MPSSYCDKSAKPNPSTSSTTQLSRSFHGTQQISPPDTHRHRSVHSTKPLSPYSKRVKSYLPATVIRRKTMPIGLRIPISSNSSPTNNSQLSTATNLLTLSSRRGGATRQSATPHNSVLSSIPSSTTPPTTPASPTILIRHSSKLKRPLGYTTSIDGFLTQRNDKKCSKKNRSSSIAKDAPHEPSTNPAMPSYSSHTIAHKSHPIIRPFTPVSSKMKRRKKSSKILAYRNRLNGTSSTNTFAPNSTTQAFVLKRRLRNRNSTMPLPKAAPTSVSSSISIAMPA